MIPIWLGLVMGLLMGTLSGLGIGGGKLLVPILVFFFGITQLAAQGVALFALIPIACIAGFIHFRTGVINIRAALWLVAGSIVGAIAGAVIALQIESDLLKRLYGGFLVIIALVEMLSRQGTDGSA